MSETPDRRCPWCGQDSLARDGVDELCTRSECDYHVDGKFSDERDTPSVEPPTDHADLVEDVEEIVEGENDENADP